MGSLERRIEALEAAPQNRGRTVIIAGLEGEDVAQSVAEQCVRLGLRRPEDADVLVRIYGFGDGDEQADREINEYSALPVTGQ